MVSAEAAAVAAVAAPAVAAAPATRVLEVVFLAAGAVVAVVLQAAAAAAAAASLATVALAGSGFVETVGLLRPEAIFLAPAGVAGAVGVAKAVDVAEAVAWVCAEFSEKKVLDSAPTCVSHVTERGYATVQTFAGNKSTTLIRGAPGRQRRQRRPLTPLRQPLVDPMPLCCGGNRPRLCPQLQQRHSRQRQQP
mmetsp:Transcript_66792/g.168644  ORF Transcript_66792/g.168644 Transcript_66792/m.168644 type:complete len:193 (+) Transcript_66792:300-878(+)